MSDTAKIVAIAAAAGLSALAVKKYLDYKKSREQFHSTKRVLDKDQEKRVLSKLPVKRVKSSMIHGVAEVNSDLLVQFNDGHRYRFYNVPPHVKKSLMGAGSHGKFFAKNIKDKYKYEKVAHLLERNLYV
jgi:uncharacterized protein (DUF2252 family)